MFRRYALSSAIAIALMPAGQGHSMTLTNYDEISRGIHIAEAGDEATTYSFVIAGNETIDSLCEDGCTIILETGVQQSFEGFEDVYIRDGRFTFTK